MAAKVTFDRERCKGCELCTVVCPKKIVELDKSTTNSKGYHPSSVRDITLCIACGNCARMCPDSVITVERI